MGAADQSIGPDSSTNEDSNAVTNDSSLGLAGDAADGASDASNDRDAVADSDIADAPGADAAENGPATVCSTDLSNIGTADFRVAFNVSTQATKYSALLNQRSICNPGTFWDVRINGSVAGSIYAEIDDGTHLVNIAGSVPINDGNVHRVVFSRTTGTLTVELDGMVAGVTPGTVGTTASLGALPALRQGADVCDGQDGTQALVGKITNVCLSH